MGVLNEIFLLMFVVNPQKNFKPTTKLFNKLNLKLKMKLNQRYDKNHHQFYLNLQLFQMFTQAILLLD